MIMRLLIMSAFVGGLFPVLSMADNVIYVYPGEDIQLAVDSSADANEDNPYLITLMPGVHDCSGGNIRLRNFVHLNGISKGATILRTNDSCGIVMANASSISNFTVRHLSTSASPALTSSRNLETFEISAVDFNVSGNGIAILVNNSVRYLEVKDSTIVTDAYGIQFKAHSIAYLKNINIFLTGTGTGTRHIGIQADTSSRVYLWGSKIGTGYGYPTIDDPGQDVISVYIPATNTGNPRIELHGLEAYPRNESARGANVNVLRAEAGWIRCFGCFGQSEIPPNWGDNISIHQSGNGRIEVYGSRFTRSEGNITGSGGLAAYSSADDGTRLDKYQCGLITLDASAGPFSLSLHGVPDTELGCRYVFKKIDDTANLIQIDAGRYTIEGERRISFTDQYDSVELMGGRGMWYIVSDNR